jgi:RND family efflux transporter MFP subunit
LERKLVRISEATQRQARALLSRAERDLMRTRILAPYDGRVRSEKVDIGQFVKRGSPVATIYATDYAEVRLPIHDEELAFLNLPLGPIPAAANASPAVTLTARFAGAEHQWLGQVVRTEGELDPKTRMINVVAQVNNPYETAGNRPPLAVGLFVDAEIHGKSASNIVIIPRAALRANNQVLIVDANNQLRHRDVQILRQVNEDIYISAGLIDGERLCISTLDNALEGMTVRTIDTNNPANPS